VTNTSNYIDLRCVKAFKGKLPTFVIGEWAVLARLKVMVLIEVTLQRMVTAEDMLSFT